MDLDSLTIFCAVAVELSITRAASRLGRVPSNVTTRIQQLEADLGVELFVRTGKRFALSTAGERFFDYAQRLLRLEEEARHAVTGASDGGALRIGCMESTAASRLPAVFATYHRRYPKTRLEVSTGPSRSLIEQVRSGRLDCAFVALLPTASDDGTLTDAGLATKKTWREELVLLAPASDVSSDRFQDIRTRSLAAFAQGCSYRAIAEDLLGIPGSGEWQVQEVGSYHAMVACVAAGACVTLLPQSVLALAALPDGLKIMPVGHVETYLLWRLGYDTQAFNHLLEQMERI